MAVSRQRLSFWIFVIGVLFVMLTGALLAALHSDAKPVLKAVSCCGDSVCEQQGHHKVNR